MELNEIAAVLKEFLLSDVNRFWLVDERVWIDGDFDDFQAAFDESDADLLATLVRHRAEDPGWEWWSSLYAPGDMPSPADGVAALLPLVRVSRSAAEAIVRGVEAGWKGHPEAVVPTLVQLAGLTIEDIGGHGSFTPGERVGRWYDERTWHWRGPVEHVPGKLHHPVPVPQEGFAPGRLASTPAPERPRMLYVSPVGGGARKLLPGMLDLFQGAGADCLLLQYDDADLPAGKAARVIRDPGHKWQLAMRHLGPEEVDKYDYLFFWDDDIDATGFDPVRFTRIMHTNRLSMAQPAIESEYGLSHRITARRPCPPPWRFAGSDETCRVVGRLTNFVEVMAPVFTREAWREFHGYLSGDNRSGWGYDYIPLGRKGIVDAMPVRHTRPVGSINESSEREIARFLDRHGLCRHEQVDQGWLLEPSGSG